MKINLLAAFIVLTLFVLTGCWGFGSRPPRVEEYKKVWGYKPVFAIDSGFIQIRSEPPRSMKNPGKIYVRGNLIFQNDIGYGIHVIDKTDPSQPTRIGFIKINGNSEMSITGNTMYVNAYSDLVVLDVANWQQVQEVKRIPNAFIQGASAGGFQHFFIPPPEKNVYYDCSYYFPQPGEVQTGWVRDSVYNMCFYK